MLTLIHKDYCTGVSHFGVSSVSELSKLPRIHIRGQDNLSSVESCSACSTAIVTSSGEKYILDGDSNSWHLCKNNTAGGSPGGGSGTVDIDNLGYATDDDIINLWNTP